MSIKVNLLVCCILETSVCHAFSCLSETQYMCTLYHELSDIILLVAYDNIIMMNLMNLAIYVHDNHLIIY